MIAAADNLGQCQLRANRGVVWSPAEKGDRVSFAGRARWVLRTNCTCPLFVAPRAWLRRLQKSPGWDILRKTGEFVRGPRVWGLFCRLFQGMGGCYGSTHRQRFHTDRIAGGDCDHRDPDRPVVAGRAAGPGAGPHDTLLEQPEADRHGGAQLPRGQRLLPPGWNHPGLLLQYPQPYLLEHFHPALHGVPGPVRPVRFDGRQRGPGEQTGPRGAGGGLHLPYRGGDRETGLPPQRTGQWSAISPRLLPGHDRPELDVRNR